MRAGFILVMLLLSASQGYPAEPAFKVGYVDTKDPYTTSPSLKECFRDLQVPAKAVGASSRPTVDRVGALFIGSFATGHKKTGKALRRNWKNLLEYVRSGGVLVVLGQTNEDEGSLSWLPPPLVAERGDRDGLTAWVADGTHPILTTPNPIQPEAVMHGEILRGRYKYAAGAYAATDVFARTEGFHTILSAEDKGAFPILMAAPLGKGAIVLMSLSPDRLCAHGRDEAARGAGRELVQNLVRFAQDAGAGGWNQAPDSFASGPEIHRVEVFLDANGNGTWDPDEAGIPDVVVTHQFQDARTGPDGRLEVTVDARDPGIVSIRVPNGMVPSRAWYETAREPGPHRFGLRALRAPRSGAGSIVHITDVHIGRTKAPDDALALRAFLRDLSDRSSPDDLFVFTGDLTHTGCPSELQLLRGGLETLENQVALVRGNHDDGNGPDKGRLFEEFLGPAFFSTEWNGFLVISLPRLEVRGAARTWFQETVKNSRFPVVVLVHHYPERTALDRLDTDKVIAVLSGHWHGDLVSHRSGLADINGPTALMGSWDFTPGSARILRLEGKRITGSELVPFIHHQVAVSLRIRGGGLLCNVLGWGDAPEGMESGEPRRISAFSWLLEAVTDAAGIRCGGKRSPPADAKPLEVRWATAVPGRVLLASPTLSGTDLIVPYRDGNATGWGGGVCAIETAGGTIKWCHRTESSVTVDPLVSGGVIHFSEVVGTLWGIRAKDGHVLWSSRLDKVLPSRFAEHFIHSSPFLKDGRAWYCYQRGPFGVRLRDGAIDWLGKPFNGADSFAHSRGTISGNYLYCGAFMGGLFRYDLGASEPVSREKLGPWDINGDLRATESAVFALSRNLLVQIAPQTGGVKQKTRVPYANLPAGFVLDGDFAVVPDENRGLRRISIASGKKTWSRELDDGPMSFILNRRDSKGLIGTPVVSGKTLYVPCSDGTLLALDRRTGKELKRWSLGIPLVSSPVVGRESVYVADYGGVVYSLPK